MCKDFAASVFDTVCEMKEVWFYIYIKFCLKRVLIQLITNFLVAINSNNAVK